MAKVRKKNRILTVNDQAVASYLKEGYDEIDNKGKVIKAATGGKTVTLGEFNKVNAALQDLSKKHDELTLEHEELKKENTALKGQVTKLENAAKQKEDTKTKDKK